MDSLRVLIVSTLAHVIEPHLTEAFTGGTVTCATGEIELVAATAGQVRFDVALVDVLWQDPAREWDFDGLDALNLLRTHGRSTATIMAAQGRSDENDHLHEALDVTRYPEVMGVFPKAGNPSDLPQVLSAVAKGERLPGQERTAVNGGRTALHEYFATGSGRTAGHLGGAVASGRATRYDNLATVAKVAPDTASKLLRYLGPLITQRGEVCPGQPVTQGAVYRWCEQHARYLLSWSRRNDPPERVMTRWQPERRGRL